MIKLIHKQIKIKINLNLLIKVLNKYRLLIIMLKNQFKELKINKKLLQNNINNQINI